MRVLVTGGGTGIGRGIAQALIDNGDEVLILGRRQSVIEGTATEIGAEPIQGDVTKDPEGILRRTGPISGIVHCAGHADHQPIGRWTDQQWRELWSVHVQGPAMLSQAFAKQCDGPGSIVLIGSTLSERPAIGTLPYASAKGAILAMARGMAAELASRQIRVNAILSGVVPTEMIGPRGNQSRAEVLESLTAIHPMGRLGTPNDIGDATVYLTHAPWVTGAVLAVDGGMLVGGHAV